MVYAAPASESDLLDLAQPPRTLPLDGFIRHWGDHQIEVIVRRTQFRLDKAEADIHLLRGDLKASTCLPR